MKRLVVAGTFVFLAALMAGVLISRLAPGRARVDATPLTAQAQPTPPGAVVVFEGIVQQASATVPSTWVVGSQPFRVVSGTQIVANGQPIQTGIWARVEALKLAGQPLEAMVVELDRAPRGEIFDRIVSIAGDQWQVGNTQVVVTDQTTIQGAPYPGALVSVRGLWSLAGLTAESAVVETQDEQAIYLGVITQYQPNQWRVDDVTVDLDESTTIAGNPEVGALVEVYGVEQGPRHMLARAIFVSSGAAEYQRRDGWLVAIEGEDYPYLWRVNLLDGTGIAPVYLAVFEGTVIENAGAPAGYQSWLDIQADDLGGGYYRARRIVVLPRPPKQTVTGIVDQLPPGSHQGMWRISGHRVEITPDTAILGAPEEGSLVTAIGTPDFSNALRAESVEVVGP